MFNDQIKFIDSIDGMLNNALETVINQNSDGLKSLLVDIQMYEKGQDGTGKKLRPYSRYTIRYKISKGQPKDRTTLRDSGDFHASIQVTAYKDFYEVSSNVPHDTILTNSKNYGKNILRINPDDFINFIQEYFITELKRNVNDRLTE